MKHIVFPIFCVPCFLALAENLSVEFLALVYTVYLFFFTPSWLEKYKNITEDDAEKFCKDSE